MTPRQWQIAVAAASISFAVLLQFVVLSRLSIVGPGLVLCTVVGIGMAGGKNFGAFAGFGAGLALDILPPADGLIGSSALALVIVGYLAGRVRDPRGLAPLQLLGVIAALAALGALVSLGFTAVLGGSAGSVPQSVVTLLGYVVVTALLGLVVVPAVGAALRRVGGGRRRRRRLGAVAG